MLIRLALAPGTAARLVPLGVATVLTGFFSLVTRRKAVSAITGLHLPGHGVEVVESDLLPVDIQPAYDGHRDLLKLGRAHTLPRELPTRSILTRV